MAEKTRLLHSLEGAINSYTNEMAPGEVCDDVAEAAWFYIQSKVDRGARHTIMFGLIRALVECYKRDPDPTPERADFEQQLRPRHRQ